jgi:hypothetical protein
VNRRAVAAACLVASPVLHLASYFLWPAGSEGSAATQLASAGAHPGAMVSAALVETIGWIVLLPALVVLWGEVRGRGAALVAAGAWLAVLGVLGFTVAGALNLVTVDLAGVANGAATYDAIRHDGRLLAAVLLPIMIGLVGLVLLLAGLARAGIGGWWLPIAGAVSGVLDQVTSESGNPLVVSAAFLPMAIALVTVGYRLAARDGRVERTSAVQPAVA